MKHHATIPRKKFNEIIIKDLDEKETVKNKELIGRRTGKNLGDHIANGNDFLLKNDFTNILEKQQRDMYDLYSSDSSSSSSKDDESSYSESEAEESERESSSNTNMETVYTKNESNNNLKKRINPTLISKDVGNVVINFNEKKINNNMEEKYKTLGNKIMKDLPVEDILDQDINLKNMSESDSEIEEEISSPEFNQNVNKNFNNNISNLNKVNLGNKTNQQPQLTNPNNKIVTAKNNFKSNKKELWSERDKVKLEADDDLNLSFTSEVKENIKQNNNRFSTKNNMNDSLNLNTSNEDSILIKNNTKNNLTNNFNRNNTIIKSKPILNTNLSTIKKDKDTSNLFTDNEYIKDKIQSEDEEKKSVREVAQVKTKSLPNEKISKNDKIIKKENIDLKNFEDDDYLNADIQNVSFKEEKPHNKNIIGSKDTFQKDGKINNNTLQNANNKLNIKNNIKEIEKIEKNEINNIVTENKKSKLRDVNSQKIKKVPSPKKENQKPSQYIENKNSKKRKFSQYQQDNVSEYENETKNKRIKRVSGSKKISLTETEFIKRSYQYMHLLEQQKIEIQKQKEQFFGVEGRYSRRNRAPKLNHIAGDRIEYRLDWNSEIKMFVPEIKYIFTNSINLENFRDQFEVKKSKKKRLVRGLKKKIDENNPRKEEEENDSNEDNKQILPEKFSEEEIDGDNIIRVFPNSLKKEVKNMNVQIKGRIIEAKGNNLVIINGKKLNNLKKNDSFEIPPLATYKIINYSKNDLRIVFKLNEEI